LEAVFINSREMMMTDVRRIREDEVEGLRWHGLLREVSVHDDEAAFSPETASGLGKKGIKFYAYGGLDDLRSKGLR
jgi:hypothetical protein